MSKDKHTNLICILITVFMVIFTVGFMNGEKLGIAAVETDSTADLSGSFSDRDLNGTWDESTAVYIDLDDMEGLTYSGAYELNGDLYLIAKGTYVLSGSLENHSVIVDAKDCKLQIVLNGADITCEDTAGIYVLDADKVFLTLAEGTVNSVSMTGTLSTEAEEAGISAAIYSRDDLTINGEGTLNVVCTEYNGIRSSDDLMITGGTVTVDSGKNGIVGHDSLRICDGVLNITAGKDGLKANNEEEKGYVIITGGDITIDAVNDAIQAETDLTVTGGTFSFITGGGYTNADTSGRIEDMFGMQAGGMQMDNRQDTITGALTELDGVTVSDDGTLTISETGAENILALAAEYGMDLDADTSEIMSCTSTDELVSMLHSNTHINPEMGHGFGGPSGMGGMEHGSQQENPMTDQLTSLDGVTVNDDGTLTITETGAENILEAFAEFIGESDVTAEEIIACTTEEELMQLVMGDMSQMPGGQMPGDMGGGFGGRSEDSQMPGQMPEASFDSQMPGGMGEMPEGEGPQSSFSPQMPEMTEESSEETETVDDGVSTSYKGLKAGTSITVTGGDFTMDCADDAVHSDGTVTIDGGSFDIATGDDAVHADELVTLNGGTIVVTYAYEGIEGANIIVNGGDITLTTSDDGFNASDGSTQVMGGFGMMGSQSSSEETDQEIPLLEINGGTITVNADGDGLDSNGDLVINGGVIYVNGPSNSGNGALDSGSESGGDLYITGGTILALGSSGMAESFSETSTQVCIAGTTESTYSSGDVLKITDSNGNTVIEYTVSKNGNSVIFSSPDLKDGETYTVAVGDMETELTASIGASISGTMGQGGGMGGMNQPGGQSEMGQNQSHGGGQHGQMGGSGSMLDQISELDGVSIDDDGNVTITEEGAENILSVISKMNSSVTAEDLMNCTTSEELQKLLFGSMSSSRPDKPGN